MGRRWEIHLFNENSALFRWTSNPKKDIVSGHHAMSPYSILYIQQNEWHCKVLKDYSTSSTSPCHYFSLEAVALTVSIDITILWKSLINFCFLSHRKAKLLQHYRNRNPLHGCNRELWDIRLKKVHWCTVIPYISWVNTGGRVTPIT